MCLYCNDPDCRDGELCHLPQYVRHQNVTRAEQAIRAFVGYLPNFNYEYYGVEQLILTPNQARRPPWIQEVKNEVRRQNGDCAYCLYPVIDPQADHYDPWQHYIRTRLAPGNLNHRLVIPLYIATVMYNDPRNLRLACAYCNRSKGDKIPGTQRYRDWLAVLRRRVQQGILAGEDIRVNREARARVAGLEQVHARAQEDDRARRRDRQREFDLWQEEARIQEIRRQEQARLERHEARMNRRWPL